MQNIGMRSGTNSKEEITVTEAETVKAGGSCFFARASGKDDSLCILIVSECSKQVELTYLMCYIG